MKKMLFLTLVLVLVMAVPAFAQVTVIGPTGNQTGLSNVKNNAQAAAGASATGGSVTNTQIGGTFSPTFSPEVNVGNGWGNFSPSAKVDNDIRNSNTNFNSNFGINEQSMNNKQSIAPIQEVSVSFKSPTQLLPLPSQIIPEINFGNGKMVDATATLPNFAMYGIKKLGAESIREVLNVNANVKFKNLYEAILSDAKDIANGGKKTLSDVRYQIVRAEAQKTWTLGANLGAGTSILSSTGASAGSGAGSLGPAWGGTKADDLFTIIFVKVAV